MQLYMVQLNPSKGHAKFGWLWAELGITESEERVKFEKLKKKTHSNLHFHHLASFKIISRLVGSASLNESKLQKN